MKIDNFDPSGEIIEVAAKCLERGGVVVYPTDTAYGVGVDAGNSEAVEKLYRLKGRDYGKPTHVVARDWAEINEICKVNDNAKRLYDKFMPGPLTMILPSRNILDAKLEAGMGTLGVRIPDCKFTLRLSERLNFAYTTPSANRTGGKTPYSVFEVGEELGFEGVDLVIDGGELQKVLPSTIVDLTSETIKIIREGPVSRVEIERMLNQYHSNAEVENAVRSVELEKCGRSMQNKFAVVTGSSTGIGKAVTEELERRGYTVARVARREKGEFACDLSNVVQVNSLIQKIKAKTDRVDVLVNAAAIWHGKDELYAGKDLQIFETKIILDTYAVGFTAPTLLIHGLLPVMGKGSSIVNISGTFENGAKGWVPYFASKRALEDLTVGLAQELKEKGIRVSCVSPSDTATEAYIKYFPEDAKDANSPEDVAKLVADVCEKDETGKFWVIKRGQVGEGFHL